MVARQKGGVPKVSCAFYFGGKRRAVALYKLRAAMPHAWLWGLHPDQAGLRPHREDRLMITERQDFFVRKDIARILSVSERTVRRYEVVWHLHETRVKVTKRIVRYHRGKALLALRSLGFL
jgi:hypothetical protein